jgi:hypothetical protein
MRNWRKPLPELGPDAVEAVQDDDEYVARLEQELRRR